MQKDSDLSVADHVGQEGLDGPEMRHDVHVKRPDDLLVRGVKEGGPRDDTGVVHEDGHWTDLVLGLLSHLVNGLPITITKITRLSPISLSKVFDLTFLSCRQ